MRGLSKAGKSQISLSEIKRKTKKRDGKIARQYYLIY